MIRALTIINNNNMNINKYIKRIFEISPVNGRESFYGKCQVLQDENDTYFLRSYDTIVASFNDKDKKVHRHWDGRTVTTSTHISAFLRRVCYDSINLNQFYKLPCDTYKF